jgi:hypothetical protein
MRELNKRIAHLEIPERMKRLPLSDEGYPVPWFVPFVDGKPEFRGMDGERLRIAVRLKRCWMCSHPLGVHMTFAIGPMCAVTRTIAEPPSHHGCLAYAVQACPFLTQPKMRRNEKDLPDERHIAGNALMRNPGVILLWTTRGYRMFKAPNGGVLFTIGDPERLEYFAEGRPATRDEIMHSIDTGMPFLRKVAEDEGKDAVAELARRYGQALQLVPA